MFIFAYLVCPRRVYPWQCTSEKGEESSGRKASCPDPGSRRRRVWTKARTRQHNSPQPNRRSQFHKRRQLFTRTRHEKFPVIPMRVLNPDTETEISLRTRAGFID